MFFAGKWDAAGLAGELGTSGAAQARTPHTRIAADAPACAPNTVAVFEAAGAAGPLCRSLDRMNYPTVRADSWSECRRACGGRTPMAAVIGDTAARPFALAAELPRDLPKVLVSADRSLAVRQEALRAGIEAVLPRPLNINELLDWLEQYEPGAAQAPVSVLLVEAEAAPVDWHAAALVAAGMLVTRASDPAQALHVLDEGAADLVLVDLERPGIDSIALTRMIRLNRRTLSVPIVFLSGTRDEERQVAAVHHSGGGDVLAGPIDRDRLVHLVRLRAERTRALRRMIERDSLTGLLRHGHFMAQAAEALAYHRRQGTPCSLAMVDIDHFKAINDRSGHPAGDQVIRTLARALVARTRTMDVVGRCGGEEFGVLFAGAPAEAARLVLEEIRAGFAATTFDEGAAPFAASFSAGVAVSETLDLPTLMRTADAALYAAKLAGRDRIHLA